MWLSCANIISLLNCPGQIERYGHVRLYWEGNRERYIQMIKPLLKNMRTTLSFRLLKLDELHTSDGLRELMTKAELPGGWQTNSQRMRNYIVYKSRHELEESLINHMPISAVVHVDKIIQSEKTYCLCKTYSGHIGMFQVKWNEFGYDNIGLWCASLTISQDADMIFGNSEVNDNVIISPISSAKANLPNYYCAITSNWQVHGENRYGVPEAKGDSFENFLFK